MINAGQLNRQITIGTLTDGINPETGRDEGRVFTSIKKVWANIKHVRGSEFFQAAAVSAERTVTFTIRYQSYLTEDNVIMYGETMYNIKAINDASEKHTIQVVTAEAVI